MDSRLAKLSMTLFTVAACGTSGGSNRADSFGPDGGNAPDSSALRDARRQDVRVADAPARDGTARDGTAGDANGRDGTARDASGDVRTTEAGDSARADTAASDAAAPPTCGVSAWPTYGHDNARTFATDGCVKGPLTVAWTYTPTPSTGHTLNAVTHALATPSAVYLQWAASDGIYVGTTAADRVSAAGTRVWTYSTATDSNLGNWASLTAPTAADGGSEGSLVSVDDGVYFIGAAHGALLARTGVDWWGMTAPDTAGGLWFADTAKLDGPGLSVGALSATAKVTWAANVQGTACHQGLSDQMGGLALDQGALYYAPLYATGSAVQPSFMSGLYAFDAAAGTAKWHVSSSPASAISAGHGLVFGIEASAIVARHQTDGSPAWTMALPGAGGQAPVLVNGLAIAAGSAGVSAFDAATGALAWSTPLSGAAAMPYTATFTNNCSGSQNIGAPIATSLAAAVPSGTLIVTAFDGVHVLSLATGADQWHGPVAGAAHPVHDPVIVGDTVYVIDSTSSTFGIGFGPGQLIALKGS